MTAASEDAIRSGGQVSAEKIEALGRLARLVELSDVSRPPAARQRWAVLTAFGGTLLIGVLLFTRESRTEIELDLEVSEVDFVLSQPNQELTETMNLSTLGASGLRTTPVLPCVDDADARPLPSSGAADVNVHLSAAGDGSRAGSMTLEPLELPADTRVRISHEPADDGYRLSLSGKMQPLRVSLSGPVEMRSGERQQCDLDMAKAVLLEPSDEVDLDIRFRDSSRNALSPQISVSRLSFLKDEAHKANRSRVHRMSTVQSGSIYFEALNGEERKLRPGEVIEFEQVDGELRTLEFKQGRIELKFRGHVRGMSRGVGENRRSLMPTWLDWLRARHGGLSVLWGIVVYLFGLIIAAFRWFGKST
ncbi:hypothetical protein WME97_41255 [Sorangium sp. So ce367]|uniref:hypothetical protein n=1 Tax=Sorangium sp. So ce367 TaxID=3133305 RepID=UPI003F647570